LKLQEIGKCLSD